MANKDSFFKELSSYGLNLDEILQSSLTDPWVEMNCKDEIQNWWGKQKALVLSTSAIQFSSDFRGYFFQKSPLDLKVLKRLFQTYRF